MSQPLDPTQPTIGRIVHVRLEPVDVPAIVTAVLGSDGTVMATAFPPGSPPLLLTDLEHDETGRAGTWHWPPIR